MSRFLIHAGHIVCVGISVFHVKKYDKLISIFNCISHLRIPLMFAKKASRW